MHASGAAPGGHHDPHSIYGVIRTSKEFFLHQSHCPSRLGRSRCPQETPLTFGLSIVPLNQLCKNSNLLHVAPPIVIQTTTLQGAPVYLVNIRLSS